MSFVMISLSRVLMIEKEGKAGRNDSSCCSGPGANLRGHLLRSLY